jgi:hypothetical protein
MTMTQRIQTVGSYLIPCVFINIVFAYATGRFGIFMLTDSVSYFSTAYNLSTQYTFVQFDGFNQSNFAPLYSMILSVPGFLGVNIYQFAWWLNLLSLNFIIFMNGVLIKEANYKHGASLIFAAAATAYFPFQMAYVFALSETLFIAFSLAFIYCLAGYFKGQHIYMAAVCMALLCLQRYAALMFFPFVLLFLIKRNIKDALLFSVISLLPISCWFARNFMQSGNVIGEHQFANKLSFAGMLDNLHRAANTLSVSPRECVATVAVLILWTITGYAIFKRSNLYWVKCMFTFSTGYIVLLFFQAGISFVEMPRYLSIIWIPCILSIGVCLNQFFNRKWIVSFFFVLVLLQSVLIVNKARMFHDSGAGYSSSKWQHVSVSAFGPQKVSHSNFPAFVWLNTDQPCNYSWFRKDAINPMPDSCTLLWFNQKEMDKLLYSPSELSQYYNLSVIGVVADDTLYSLSKKRKEDL